MLGCPTPYCGESFNTHDALEYHQKSSRFHPCLTCAKEFPSIRDLNKHVKDTAHKEPTTEKSLASKLQWYLEKAYYQWMVKVTRDDRQKSRIIVQEHMKKILRNVRLQKDGGLYSNEIRSAGSTATQTKIIKADEFDYNLPLAQPFVDYYKFSGDSVKYKFKHSDGHKTLDQHLKLQNRIRVFDCIPNGYIVALHKNNAPSYVQKHSYCQEVIPRWVQEDLYKKVKFALTEERMTERISLQTSPHGPAVTLIISDPSVQHKISVDLAVSIDVDVSLTIKEFSGWPREQTKKILSSEQIQQVEDAGLILVPKKEKFWYVSFSKAVRELMNIIDKSDDCRIMCHKILKRDFKKWQSQSKTGMHGISTYLFKHHLLWMNEDKQEPDYWRNQNIGLCYRNMLSDLESKLRQGKLTNYFKDNGDDQVENILDGVRQDVIKELVHNLIERRKQLIHIAYE